MTDTKQAQADARFSEALGSEGARDPREFYRERLRELKQANPLAYEQASTHYQDVLIPGIADGTLDPLDAWMAYGCQLCQLLAPGKAVDVDGSGRRRPHAGSSSQDHLVLHIPDAPAKRALLIGLPRELSAAQQATYALLVQGRLKMRS